MSDTNSYKCVNCGQPAAALYKTYGPTVLKLTKCENCKGVVDKYIEYDPVIVMIDLVLISREAQRHVLYNMEFKAYWKLLIVLIMLETYGVWRQDSLFNIVVNSMCSIPSNNTINFTDFNIPISVPIPEVLRMNCLSWEIEQKADDADLFLWEKDFYVQFISTFAGICVFIMTVQCLMRLMRPLTRHTEVALPRLLKAYSLANAHIILSLPMLVWGADAPASTRTQHYSLAFAYSFVVFLNVFTVIYECPATLTTFVLIVSNIIKYLASFHATPYLRKFIT